MGGRVTLMGVLSTGSFDESRGAAGLDLGVGLSFGMVIARSQ